jgi:hypothetical protein
MTYKFGYNSDLDDWLAERAKNSVLYDLH